MKQQKTGARLIALALALAGVPLGDARAEDSEPEKVLQAMKGFCMGTLCLGMTLDEAAATGDLSDIDESRRRGTCAEHDVVLSTFIARDGTKFRAAFRSYPLIGSARSRYRLIGITLNPEVSNQQLDYLRSTLTDRYKMVPDSSRDGLWTLQAPLFDLYVGGGRPGSLRGIAELVMYVEHRRFMQWVLSQPQCRAGLPKI